MSLVAPRGVAATHGHNGWRMRRGRRVVAVLEGVAFHTQGPGGVGEGPGGVARRDKARLRVGAWPGRGDALGGGAGRGRARGLRDRRREAAGLPLSAAILVTAEAGGFL